MKQAIQSFFVKDGRETFDIVKRYSDFVAMFTRMLFISLLVSFIFEYIKTELDSIFFKVLAAIILIILHISLVVFGIMIVTIVQAYIFDAVGVNTAKNRVRARIIFLVIAVPMSIMIIYMNYIIRQFSRAQLANIYTIEKSINGELSMPPPPIFLKPD